MPRGKRNDPKLEQNIEGAMEGTLVPMVYMPPGQRIKGKKGSMVVKRYDDTRVQIQGEIVRIQQEADPTGFLIAVVNGAAFVSKFIDENGNIHERIEFPTLTQRIKVAQHLQGVYMPKLGVVKHILPPGKDGEGDGGDPNGRPSFAQLVELAASAVEVDEGDDDGDQPCSVAGAGEEEQGSGGS
jgi:hypothetical protein